jgi:hypothetical protein
MDSGTLTSHVDIVGVGDPTRQVCNLPLEASHTQLSHEYQRRLNLYNDTSANDATHRILHTFNVEAYERRATWAPVALIAVSMK